MRKNMTSNTQEQQTSNQADSGSREKICKKQCGTTGANGTKPNHIAMNLHTCRRRSTDSNITQSHVIATSSKTTHTERSVITTAHCV